MSIAVLVPAYNAEKYLTQCLDSIRAQTLPGVEIFVCDDGSTDATRYILMEYALRYERIHVLTQENKGVVATLNRLLDELPPEVEYFTVVDSDDYIHPEMLETLLDALHRTGADVAECDIIHVPSDAKPPEGFPKEPTGDERTIEDLSIYLLKRTAPNRAWINKNNKLYRRAAVQSLRFRPGLAFEEDYFYGCEVNAAIRRKVLVPCVFYAYRDNPSSVTHALNLPRYFASTSERVRLTLDVFLNKGRIPKALEKEYRRDLAKDAYRMCIRKNLKKNKSAAESAELFSAASQFFQALEKDYGFKPVGLNPIQRWIYHACVKNQFKLAKTLSYLT